ncbi:hypothetical protein C7974DRAFT_333760, partial [Boeremia exigua]|uniref:uncharacterized protein n=1 Tax=Boeremia exigua TaxID=749465 RepID=UPI001E8DC3C2
MASLVSLSAELKLSIIEQLELQSGSFIPAPSLDLLSLSRFPNLECVIVEFRCSRAKEKEEEIYSQTYDIFEELEEPQMTLGIEEADAFRSLTKRTYDAIAQNPPYTIKSLELRNVVAKRCSAWETSAFRALLEGLSAFKISLRGGDNGAGWRINKVAAYLSFVGSLDTIFLGFANNLKHLSISATTDGPPGLAEGMNNVELPLKEDILKNLEILELEHVFISKDLAAFIVAHGSSLNTI